MSSKWVSDDASNVCMKCGAEFGRLLGASRHHCRACGELICQTCKVEAQKVSHVMEPGKEELLYLVPGSQFELLKRPTPTSVIGSAYTALSSAAHIVKFCQACNANIQKEHQAFAMADYLLNTLRLFPQERQLRVISICVRAHLANYESPTAMSIVGRDVVRTLRESFYQPKVRYNLQFYDQTLNYILAGFFRIFVANYMGNKFSEVHVAKVDSILTINPVHNYLSHVFISVLLNGAHIPDMRADTLRYLIADPYRCLHMLLSRFVLGYKVSIYSIFQTRAWKSILMSNNIEFFTKYPVLLSSMVQSSTETPTPYSKFVSTCRTLGNKYRQLTHLLCNSNDKELCSTICQALGMEADEVSTMFQTLHAKLLSIVYDTEQLESMIQVPWTIQEDNALVKLPLIHPILDMIHKIYSQEPRTIQVDHVVSSKTNHVARIFQSWYVFSEPNFILHQAMKHIFDLSVSIHPEIGSKTLLYPNMNYLYTQVTDTVMCILPGTCTESRVVHVDKNTFSQNVEMTLHVLTTILLMQHLMSFVELEVHNGLNLVEVGSTERNSILIRSCLTYSSIQAIKKFVLKGSLHAHTVLGIHSILTKIINSHLPELYTGILCLTKAGIPHAHITKYLDDVRQITNQGIVRDLVLKYLV